MRVGERSVLRAERPANAAKRARCSRKLGSGRVRKCGIATQRCERPLSGAQAGEAYDGYGSGTAGREGLERSFKRPGGQEDVQTLPTAVHRPCLSPLNASDDCNAPIADIVPPH